MFSGSRLAVVLALYTLVGPVRAIAEEAETPKRAVPDYDGREEPSNQDADLAAAPFRVLLSPLLIINEAVRWSLGSVITAAERTEVPRKLYDFFLFAPGNKGGVVPVGFTAFGLSPSAGVYAFWDDAFGIQGHHVHTHIEAWPTDWFLGTFVDRLRYNDDKTALGLRAQASRRPDRVFYGFGPSSRQEDQSRYREDTFETNLSFETRTWRRSQLLIASGARATRISSSNYNDDPSVDESAAMSAFALPYGFGRSYAGPTGRVYASLDTRDSDDDSGVHLAAQADGGSDLTRQQREGWLRYGAVATGIINVDHRALEVSAATMFADPLTADPIPFTELVELGGKMWMPGFHPGRLVDRSAAITSARYSWPIAPYLSATLQTTVGNVFGPRLEGFDARLLRLSGAVGLRTTSNPHVELVFGVGTDTFENGAGVDSLHLSFGVPHEL